ncbi:MULTISPECIES: hypothetical protein [unclassified Streptomyces]|nr:MULTISPECIES: hypothetical protein [unclassified Streptomyces]MCX5052360.1 hypothetical protein [Streptomyces sp. NBC_00474]
MHSPARAGGLVAIVRLATITAAAVSGMRSPRALCLKPAGVPTVDRPLIG